MIFLVIQSKNISNAEEVAPPAEQPQAEQTPAEQATSEATTIN